MSRSNIVLLVLTSVLLAKNYSFASYIMQGDNDMETNIPTNDEDVVDLQLLGENENRASLFYTFNDCAPLGEICYSLFKPYRQCCPDTHCYCTIVYCYCSDNVSAGDNGIISQPDVTRYQHN